MIRSRTMTDIRKLIRASSKFKDKNILVVGDLILDKFVTGRVRRISPEAPVPVVEITSEIFMPGGAGNVACNITKLGAGVSLVSAVGNDLYGRELLKQLGKVGSVVDGVIVDRARPTSVKTRIIAEHQQVVRTDMESKDEISSRLTSRLIKNAVRSVHNADGIVISDYGKGLITSGLIGALLSEAAKKGIPVVVDPQVGHFFEYRDVTSLTPNINEASSALNTEIYDLESLLAAGRELIDKLGSRTLLITRGEEGMSLFYNDGRVEHIPTMAREVFDVTGAGDTVSSVFTLSLASGLDFLDAAVLSNYAAAVVVGKLGTATVTRREIIEEMEKRA